MNDRRIKEAGSLRSLFSQQWFHIKGLLQLKRRRLRNNEKIAKRIEQIVDGTDGKVRIISDYNEQLALCAQAQIGHVNSIYQSLANITPLTEPNLDQSDFLQTVFYTMESMQNFLGKEKELADFIKENRLNLNDKVYALLKITKQQKTVFMPGLVNGKVINDVKQIQISFAQRYTCEYAKSESELLSNLKQYLHNSIVDQVKIELAPLLAHANGLASMLSAEDFKNPNTYLSALKSVMLAPEKTLYLEEHSLVTNRFGILSLNDTIEKERTFTIKELTLNNHYPYLLVPVSIRIKDLP